MNYNSFFLFLPCLFSLCLCEISEVKKSKLLSDFINYYNLRPNIDHKASDGFLQSISEIDDTTYHIEVSFRAQHNDVSKMMKCQAGIEDLGKEGIAIVNNAIDCIELEQQAAADADASLEAVEHQAERRPVVLDNEDEVDPDEQEVQVLANMGIEHLDIHDPSSKHSLNSVIEVKRQVQVANGVRYILTLSINFNNCNEIINNLCTLTKTCRITILVKPWQSLPSGAKYRTVLANTCTEKKMFSNDHSKIDEKTFADIDEIKIKQYENVNSLPNREKTLMVDEIKTLEKQKYPHNRVSKTWNWKSDTLSQPSKEMKKQNFLKTKSNPQFKGNFIPGNQFVEADAGSLSHDKKKTIDEMLDFLTISGYKPQVHSRTEDSVKRSKRSYDYDLQLLSLTQDYRDLKKSIENAKYIYEMAQFMVDYLNIKDIEVKNRAVKNVIKAEEEEDDEKHFLYIQVQVVIPCDSQNCDGKYTQTKICNGVVDSTNKEKPQVLYSFCYNDNKEMAVLDKFKEIESDDPVLLRLSKGALKKIELESTEPHAMKIKKIVSANTRLTSSRLTKFSMIVEYINCNKSVPLVLRKKCLSLEQLGTRICEILVHEREWLKEKTITYTCTERPMDFIISKDKQLKNMTINDPKITEIIQDALQYLEIKSNKKFKLKIIEVSNISTQVLAGFLIKIEFVVGYTNCTDIDMNDQLSKCELLKHERLRRCKAQVWDRSWIVDGRQMEVSCEDDLKVKQIHPKSRVIRNVAFDKEVNQKSLYKLLKNESDKNYLQKVSRNTLLGGEIEQNSTNPIYVQMAQESLEKYLKNNANRKWYKVVVIKKVTTQIVEGSMTRIHFTAAPSSSNDHEYECFSKIWEQPWDNKKEIDVSCVNLNQRSKRELLGGQTEQNPNDPLYIDLAKESLNKYILENKNQQTLSFVRIDKVTTQVVSGTLTRIHFKAASSSNDREYDCLSKIWEQPWINKKQIDVSCVNPDRRSKRQVLGGETEQNPIDPLYIDLAKESLKKYILENKSEQPLSFVRIDKVTTQVVAGTLTRIHFKAAHNKNLNDREFECFSKIWEQPWINKKQIDVSCVNPDRRSKRQVLGGETEQNPIDPLYIDLAKESLKKYILENKNQQPLSFVRIDKVTTQVVSGKMTRIHFKAAHKNSNDREFQCFSKIWEQPWINKKQIDVSCVNPDRRSKRQVLGGETEQNPIDPLYIDLAKESLKKYILENKNQQPLSFVRIDKVTTQVVSGKMTRIHFKAAHKNSNDREFQCFSKIWEQPWINKKQIDVSCVNPDRRSKRQVLGGETEQNPIDPLYIDLAKESLKKYILENKNQQPLSFVRIDKVTTQVVSGKMTRIHFKAAHKNSNDREFQCFSKIWEQPWINKKQIDVSCVNPDRRSKRQVSGGEMEQNPIDPLYIDLAKESLKKYILENKSEQPLSVVRIDKVTTQVVGGTLTRIHFKAAHNKKLNDREFECFSKIWEKPGDTDKEIDVSCVNPDQRSKRQVSGGEMEQNPIDPLYIDLAKESLKKYILENKNQQPLSFVRIDKVTTQVVAGTLTRIHFKAAHSKISNDRKFECFSKIWEKPGDTEKEIDVSCVNPDRRSKRQVLGGETEQNPIDPLYIDLAKESLKKYFLENKNQPPLSFVRIDKVTTQVVAGTLTRIYFKAAHKKNLNDREFECFSKIWEQPWINKKQIDVSCVNPDRRSKRQVLGGETEQNPIDPLYIDLAKESLKKYFLENKNQPPLSFVRIDKVTTQVVAGTLTRIYFKAAHKKNLNDREFECFSKIWEQPWINKKQIDVSCVNPDRRSKRQVLGGETEQNPIDPLYIDLAKESLKKYILENKNQQPLSFVRIDKVTTQVVSGKMTRIHFKAAHKNSNDREFECFSKIWEQPWINKKQIDVSCVNPDRRSKRQVLGGETEQNPIDPLYIDLAKESLKKYILENKNQQPLSFVRIDKVTTQVVSGKMTRIHFKAAHKNSNDREFQCFSKIWEQSWINKKQIDVSCVNPDRRSKRQVLGGETEKNPIDPLYIDLAKESLKKYILENKSEQPLSFVRIDKVTTQVDAGTLTRIHFKAAHNKNLNDREFECFSKIWEKPGDTEKEIDVSCVNPDQRSKRQVSGGEMEQNPIDPLYIDLAKESLKKYILENKNQQPLSFVRIDKVTTQVVAGTLTRIHFKAAHSKISNDREFECFSKIWEQPWINKKQIDVSCVNPDRRSKRQVLGGETEQNPIDPLYIDLAKESLKKYFLENKNQPPLSFVRIDKVTTQVVAGTLTRIYFKAAHKKNLNDREFECFSKIWEQPWINKKQIDVSCVNPDRRSKRQVLGGETEQNPIDPLYIDLAKESLKKYILENKNQQPLSFVRIDKVTTQVVSGKMTRIHFKAAHKNSNDREFQCFSKIWEQSWINKKQIDVSCVNPDRRSKRQVLGGETEQNPIDPLYIDLAKESLKKYILENKSEQPLSFVRIDKVTTQVVAGTLTRIHFKAAHNKNLNDREFECFSKIWEKPGDTEKEIDVSCVNPDQRSKRQVSGGEMEQNPIDPLYIDLAKESLKKYILENENQQPLSFVRIDKVTTQVVAGTLTRIHFKAAHSKISNDREFECFSKIWEKPGDTEKEIDVSCVNPDRRSKRQVLGGETEQNPIDPLYIDLAKESLKKYFLENKNQPPLSFVRIDKVTTQVVSGKMTRIHFKAAHKNSNDREFQCFSKIWEQSWINKKQIDVSCVNPDRRSKRQVLGGETEQNPIDPLYIDLAKESLKKYILENKSEQPLSFVRIDKVTTQVVAGTLTRIHFKAAHNKNLNDREFECFSKIWEKPGDTEKEIDVSCVNPDQRSKRQVSGGEMEQNPIDPLYIDLAKESLKKYILENKNQQPLSFVRIDKVTTQVVAGTLTRIHFKAAHSKISNDREFECFSKIWEKPGDTEKEIDVSCVNPDQRSKRQVSGGEMEQNPIDPLYIDLAKESLKKYILENKNQQPLSFVRIDKVTTQVVAGTLTRIHFKAAHSKISNDHEFECFSKIWEKPGDTEKEIDVSCVNPDRRSKRQVLGGETEQNPIDPLYIDLAKESLKKYFLENKNQPPLSFVRIDKVTTQVVAGTLTRIYFKAAHKKNLNDREFECFSKIWEQPWINKKQIDVSCVNPDRRSKRQVLGGETEQNPIDPLYIDLAKESLKKYILENKNQQPLSFVRIDKVTAQVVSGKMTRIHFKAAHKNSNDREFECFSKIWEQPWINKKQIDVSCVNPDRRSKRQVLGGETEQNPIDPLYIDLAKESLKKYILENKNQQPLSFVRIDKVTTQVVSGKMTRIHFKAAHKNSNDREFQCFSKIWEQSWINKKQIDVSCVNPDRRSKRQVLGGETEQNPIDPLYIDLAKESLKKYILENKNQQPLSFVRIDKVTTQVVSGKMTRIHFKAAHKNLNDREFQCFSKIWEQPWINKKQIDVSCVNPDRRSKRQVSGGEMEQNPFDPLYIDLAKESLKKYILENKSEQPLSFVRIEKVTIQVVAGALTRIHFKAASSSSDREYDCLSKIWERPWVNKKQIDVACVNPNQRSKRQIPGGEVEKNPNDSFYWQLAAESLNKYLVETGNQHPLSVVRIDKVSTQIVSGTITRIHFIAAQSTNSNDCEYQCFSKIWEQPWVNKKEIDVSCVNPNQRSKLLIPGGETEKNPNDPLYWHLAEESLNKYLVETRNQHALSVVRIEKVTTQVVSGEMTRIHFKAAHNTNLNNDVFDCFSKIWKRPGDSKKEIVVSCVNLNQRFKRQIPGGEVEKNPNDSFYWQLAEESLNKYLVETGNQHPLSVVRIDKVTTKIVSGTMTRIHFKAAQNTNSNDCEYECFSKIWEQPWVNKKEIDVSCVEPNYRFKKC